MDELIAALLGGFALNRVISGVVKVPGLLLEQNFKSMSGVVGKTKTEIIAVVGNPSSVSRMPNGETLLQWMATGYHIALAFQGERCKAINHESTSGSIVPAINKVKELPRSREVTAEEEMRRTLGDMRFERLEKMRQATEAKRLQAEEEMRKAGEEEMRLAAEQAMRIRLSKEKLVEALKERSQQEKNPQLRIESEQLKMEFLAINKAVTPPKVSRLSASSVEEVVGILAKNSIINFDLYLNLNAYDLSGITKRLEKLELNVEALTFLLAEKMQISEVPQAETTLSPENNDHKNGNEKSEIVSVELLEKILLKANAQLHEYQDKFLFSVMLHNRSQKPVRAVKGSLVFSDLFGVEIFKVSVTINLLIEPLASVKWSGELPYNQFLQQHVIFAGFDKKDLCTKIEDLKVIFA